MEAAFDDFDDDCRRRHRTFIIFASLLRRGFYRREHRATFLFLSRKSNLRCRSGSDDARKMMFCDGIRLARRDDAD